MAKKNVGKTGKSDVMPKSAKQKKVSKAKKSNNDNLGKIVFFSIVGIVVIIAAVMWGLSMKPKADSSDAAAVINGETILSSDLNSLYERLPAATKAQVTKAELLDQMVNEKILMQEAKKLGFDVNQSEIDDFLGKLLLQSGISKEDFLLRLQAQNISEEMVNDEIYKQLLITKLYQSEVIEKIKVSDADLQNYYDDNSDSFVVGEKVNASHILICYNGSVSCTSNLTKDEALKKIEEIKNEATASNFASLAMNFSVDSSARYGGNLGYFEKGVMVKPFEDAAFSTAVGSVSDVVESQYGYHIILVNGKTPERVVEINDVKQEISQIVLSQKQEDAFKSYLDDLKAKADIQISYAEN